jgi:pimeloyl-ACP methyl ester carboxylesterase
MADFVLVHGAWHGGWCWRRVGDILTARGHRVFAPTLTGLGERSHLLAQGVDLGTHITDIVNVITWEELGAVVLCGHSYGGMVVTGVADRVPDRIAALVYLDAYVPEGGVSMQDLRPRELPAALGVAPTSAAAFLVNEADRDWVDRRCTPHPVASIVEKLALTGAYRAVRRKRYIRAAGYPHAVFAATCERLKADPGWSVHTIDCGHDVMVDRPETLADLLETA